MLSRREITPEMLDPEHKKQKTEIDNERLDVTIKCAFLRTNYTQDPDLPKSKILTFCRENKLSKPQYKVYNEDKLFRAVATIGDKKYSSSYW